MTVGNRERPGDEVLARHQVFEVRESAASPTR